MEGRISGVPVGTLVARLDGIWLQIKTMHRCCHYYRRQLSMSAEGCGLYPQRNADTANAKIRKQQRIFKKCLEIVRR